MIMDRENQTGGRPNLDFASTFELRFDVFFYDDLGQVRNYFPGNFLNNFSAELFNHLMRYEIYQLRLIRFLDQRPFPHLTAECLGGGLQGLDHEALIFQLLARAAIPEQPI